MLRRFLAKFKSINTPVDRKEEKKRVIKKWVSKIGVNWCDIEDLLFWKDPRVSLAVFIILTGFFWKFISYKLQKIGLIIIAIAFPTTVSEIRRRIWSYCVETFHLEPRQENRRLGFDCDDFYEVTSDFWIELEDYYLYLLNLKYVSTAKFYLFILAYITLMLIVLAYIPFAGIFYTIGTILYFYPILNYLGVFGIGVEFGKKLFHPFIVHWAHSKTKRKRDGTRRPRRYISSQGSVSDIENEEFLPAIDGKAADFLRVDTLQRSSDQHSNGNDSFDEFDLRGQFHRKAEADHSSDYDEDTFLPSYNYGPSEEMPSLSNFDSMLEPLEDDFHAGLNFNNVTAVSTRNLDASSDYDTEDETDQDVADISLDQVETQHYLIREQISMSEANQNYAENVVNTDDGSKDDDDVDGTCEIDIDQEFEFLDRTELYDVTDEEINEQNVGQHSLSENISKGVSNILGY